jgi:hypothetical protein
MLQVRAGADLAGLCVLVVEDEADTLELFQSVLGSARADVRAVSSTRAALDELVLRLPHVLIADIGLPEQDGYSLIRCVRGLAPESGGTTPAIAITAYARDDDRQRALDAGYDAHVTKPVDPDVVCRTVAMLAGRAVR